MKKVLILGSGSIAKKHQTILNQLGFETYLYSEKNRFSQSKNNKLVKFIKNKDELKNILDNNYFYFALIANETFKHFDTINFCIKYNLNIFCEKPITSLKFDYKKLSQKIIQKKLFFMCNYQLRNLDCILKIKKILKNEKIVSFNMSVGHNLLSWRKDKLRNESYFINKRKGGGVIFELIHEINLINFIFGDFLKIKTFKRTFNQNLYCEDVAVSIIKMRKNIIGNLYQDMVSPVVFRKLDIICKKNYYEVDLIKNIITINKLRKIIFKKTSQINLIKKNLINYINLSKKKPSLKFYDEAVNDLKIVLKMHDEI